MDFLKFPDKTARLAAMSEDLPKRLKCYTLYYKWRAVMAKPPLSDPIPLRVPTDILADIETIAKASDRTRSWVMVRALRHYLAGEGGDILKVVKGREAIAAGDVHDMDDVIGEIEEIVRGKVA